MKTKAPSIHLTIDRLVLNGVAPGQQHDVVAALTAELERRLAIPGGATALGTARSLASMRAPSAQPRGSGGSAIGVAAARGIEGVLKR